MENINEILSLDLEKNTSHFKKGEILQKPGVLSTSVFRVKKELLRSYTIDALEDSVVVPFAKSSPPKSNLYKLHMRIGVLQKRIIMLMSASAIERYNHFLEIYPDNVQRVPQKMIASHLGITPQVLSTIRGKIARKK